MAKSKFFRVAVEGATTDGRVIERSWIQDMADTYSPATYGARINLEHFRGILPDGPFKAYGDVVAARAEEITDGALKGKLGLFAQIEPTPEMVAMNKARQKIYTSCEVQPNFAKTGKAYLVGLAVTDSPASLGTEMLTFAAQHPDANPLATRKQDPANLFTAAEAVEIEFEDDAQPSEHSLANLFKAVKSVTEKLRGKSKTDDANFADIEAAFTDLAEGLQKFADNHNAASQQTAERFTQLLSRLEKIEGEVASHKKETTELRAELEAAPGAPKRPPATGGNGQQNTDC